MCVSVDVRLNPVLMKSCMPDISKFCQRELDEVKSRNVESEGRVMFCLRRRFANKVTSFSPTYSRRLSLSVCLSVCLSVRQSVCLSVRQSVCLSVRQAVCISAV